MAGQPKILQVVSEMRVEGFSDKDIIENLRQLGLSDDQIKQIMKVADQDIYSKFKREMGKFVDGRIQKDTPMIEAMVGTSMEKRISALKKEVTSGTERIVGDFAKTINDKSNDLSLALKKVREENLNMVKDAKLMRADIDMLLAGPSRLRLFLSLFFLFLSIILLGYVIFFALPPLINLDIVDTTQIVVNLAIVLGLMATTIMFATVGVYFSGKPGRQ